MLAEIYLLKLEAAVRAAKEASEFERALADFAGAPNGGLIVPLSTSAETHRTLIVALADRHRLPAVYPSRVDAAIGGLISYGPDQVDQNRRAAGYVDRILKGEKPADLPVQAPTKYECRGRLCVERRSAAAAAQRGGGEGHQGAGAKD
jgi:putative ABC transport system substrate-binding protein